jgi:AraC-like DNA-binding protein
MNAPTKSFLSWPRDTAQAARQAVGASKCFMVSRAHTVPSARFVRKPIRLSTNCLFLVTCGSVVIERGGQRLTVDLGAGCLVLPGDLRVSEIPDGVGRFIYHVIFFHDAIIKFALSKFPHADALAATMRPAFVELYPMKSASSLRWLCSLVAGGRPIPDGIIGVLRLLLFEMFIPAYLFLHHGYFAQRQGLCLWMEEHIVSASGLPEIAAMYLGGPRRFYTKYKVYQDVSPARWLRRRRMELAAGWLKHGVRPPADIRKALGYLDDATFRRDYRLERGVSVNEGGSLRDGPGLSQRLFREMSRAFWQVDETTWQRRQATAADDEAKKVVSEPNSNASLATIINSATGANSAADGLDNQDHPPSVRLQNAIKAFWNLEASAVRASFESRQEEYVSAADQNASPALPDLLESSFW